MLAHSNQFDAIPKNSFSDSKTSIIEMAEVSEDGVSAFLEYLYMSEITAATNSSKTAFELFLLGNQYKIRYLENEMEHILMAGPANWFDLETTFRLFLFVQNKNEYDGLKAKAVKLIKL